MEMFINKQIGKNKYTFVAEGENLFEMVMESKKLSFYDVSSCGLCGSDNLFLSAHFAGKKNEYEYTTINCGKCGATLTFGQTKADKNVFFLRKNDKKEFDWKSKENKSEEKEEEPEEKSDLPF